MRHHEPCGVPLSVKTPEAFRNSKKRAPGPPRPGRALKNTFTISDDHGHVASQSRPCASGVRLLPASGGPWFRVLPGFMQLMPRTIRLSAVHRDLYCLWSCGPPWQCGVATIVVFVGRPGSPGNASRPEPLPITSKAFLKLPSSPCEASSFLKCSP